MTEKERKIFNSINQLKVDYPVFYKMFKWVSIFITSIPIFIWFSYRMGHHHVLIPTDTSEGELLAFYGTILSFISTLGLGALALWQNIKANNINNRLSLIEKKRFKLELQPFVVVTDWSLKKESVFNILDNSRTLRFQISNIDKQEANCAFLTLHFTNTSNTFTTIDYLTGSVYYNDKFVENLSNGTINKTNTTLYLESGQKGEMEFYCSFEKFLGFDGKKVQLKFNLRNKFNDIYRETIDIFIPTIFEADDDKGWDVVLNTQNYKIERFNKETNQFEDD